MYLVWSLFWGLVCGSMAEKRGKNVSLGFLGGALFGIFSAIYYLWTDEGKK